MIRTRLRYRVFKSCTEYVIVRSVPCAPNVPKIAGMSYDHEIEHLGEGQCGNPGPDFRRRDHNKMERPAPAVIRHIMHHGSYVHGRALIGLRCTIDSLQDVC
jgi:hypothetical protein